MATYQPAKGAQLSKEDADILGRQFEKLARKGPLTAQTVVNAAKPARSPLHKFFEWNDERAAELYRQEQARYYLRSIEIVIAPSEQPIRAFHVVTVQGEGQEGERGYLHIDQVRSNPTILAQVIDAERRVLRGAQRRLAQYKQLEPVAAVVEQAIEQLSAVA